MTSRAFDPRSRTNLREITKLLRKMAFPRTTLVCACDPNGVSGDASGWHVHNGGNGNVTPLSPTAKRLIPSLSSDDLIEKADADHWRISAAGRSWLKRRLSGSDPFQAQQMHRLRKAVEVDGVRTVTNVNMGESPLAWLRQRNGRQGSPLIDDAQFSAGERLRFDFTRAHLSPRVTSDWGALPGATNKRSGNGGGAADLLDSVIEAGKRFNRAVQAVGPELSDVLIDVCCFLKGLEETEKKNKWPRRSAKLILQMALTRLARHYGLNCAPVRQQQTAKTIRHWGAGNYRPAIDGDS